MLKDTGNGNVTLSFNGTGVIRRIPIERRGNSKSGREWVLGGVLLEMYEDGVDGSVPLYLTTWSEEMIEVINRIGVGKKVSVEYHIECRENYSNYRTNVIIDEIGGVTEGEDFVYNTKGGMS